MLDTALKTQLQAYLTKLQQPIELIASLDDSEKSRELQALLQEIASLSDKITLTERRDDAERKPSFAITRVGHDMGIRFAGIPLGHEFTSLVLALLWAGGHPPKVEPEVIEQIQAIDGDFEFETFISLSCHNCPEVVQAFTLMAVFNPRIRHTMIDGALFQEEVDRRQIMAVPMVFMNGEHFGQGRMELAELLAKIDTGAVARAAAAISQKPEFDVLVVGGGPAGAAAAIYAARKGIRTGIVAERIGGQVMDTMAIENFISVTETDGPKLAAG
ncbi:MAG: thioredoxin family protein, partial [Burkholderiaceae bacterium]